MAELPGAQRFPCDEGSVCRLRSYGAEFGVSHHVGTEGQADPSTANSGQLLSAPASSRCMLIAVQTVPASSEFRIYLASPSLLVAGKSLEGKRSPSRPKPALAACQHSHSRMFAGSVDLIICGFCVVNPTT